MKLITTNVSFLDLADAVRAAVCQLYDEAAKQPVHFARILGVLHDRFGPLLDDSDDAPVWALVKDQDQLAHSRAGSMLHFLDHLGDLVHVGDGYYIPTAARLIRLPNDWSLILSGESSDKLASEVRFQFDRQSLGRFVHSAGLADANTVTTASLDGWLNRPLWCRDSRVRTDTLKGALVRVSEETNEWQLYQPTLRTASYHKGRWVDACAEDANLNGLVLCKHRTGRHYAAGRLARSGKSIRFTRRVDLTGDELAEACMLRDRENSVTTVLRLSRNDNIWVFSPRFRLPAFMVRYFVAFAWQIDGDFGESLAFSFTDMRLSVLEGLLRGLPVKFRRK